MTQPVKPLRRSARSSAFTGSSAVTAQPAAQPAALTAAAAAPAVLPAAHAPAAPTSPAPAEVRTPPTLRQRYPFLNEPDCPVELHALVGHRISKYNDYTQLYARLQDCTDLKDCADTASSLLEAYLDNRDCTRELDYYQKHRRLLGRHPLLDHFRELTKLRAKTTRQLFEERKRTRDNIWRAESQIRKGDKPHLDSERRARIQQYRLKLLEINSLLGKE